MALDLGRDVVVDLESEASLHAVDDPELDLAPHEEGPELDLELELAEVDPCDRRALEELVDHPVGGLVELDHLGRARAYGASASWADVRSAVVELGVADRSRRLEGAEDRVLLAGHLHGRGLNGGGHLYTLFSSRTMGCPLA